jgi:hypothetical protein
VINSRISNLNPKHNQKIVYEEGFSNVLIDSIGVIIIIIIVIRTVDTHAK